MYGTTCRKYPTDLLLRLTRPFKDQDGTILLYTASPEGLGRGHLFLNPLESGQKPQFSGEPYPVWAGFISYEGEAYFQKSGFSLRFDPELQSLDCFGEEPEGLFEAYERSPASAFSFKAQYGKEEFIKGCLAVRELILEGEVYQLNLSHEIQFSGEADPFSLFEQLVQVSKAPFAAYMCSGGRYYLCLSPERLLSNRLGVLQTEPIKGTIRSEDPLESLTASCKERSELLMITDLMRNDLKRIAKKKSVSVKSLCETVSFPHLIHMRSLIQAELEEGKDPFEALMTIFPGGSITGCPKINAMKYIADLEKAPRGIFTGSIGYFCGNGDFDFNIAIRTLVKEGDRWSLKVGSGIVFDSDPEKEYRETLCKARPFLDVML